MKEYIKNFKESRKIFDLTGSDVSCEYRWKNCMGFLMEVHHIDCSYRGKRDNNPYWLIWVCRNCHNEIHNNNNHLNRNKLLGTVKYIIDEISHWKPHPIWVKKALFKL